MTTQAEVKSNQTSQAPSRIHKSIWPYALAVLLAVFVVSAVILLTSPERALSASNQRAMDAMAARYQGLAELHAKNVAALERGWQASAARYQGLAELHASNDAALERGWQASAARYQGLADLQAKQALSPAQAAMAARYQGLAELYAKNVAALERGWQASAARYQGLAEQALDK